MFKIEKIGEDIYYIKVLGTFPKSVAKRFVKEFKVKTQGVEKFFAIVDGVDLILLNLKSFKIILKLLQKNNKRLIRSAYIISGNPVLKKEAEILLERSQSPNRKIVSNLDDAKKWVGIEKIIIQKD